ncbi:MAG: hypothetical protein AAFR16_07515, partial [Pseudomonadota bacterium]
MPSGEKGPAGALGQIAQREALGLVTQRTTKSAADLSPSRGEAQKTPLPSSESDDFADSEFGDFEEDAKVMRDDDDDSEGDFDDAIIPPKSEATDADDSDGDF